MTKADALEIRVQLPRFLVEWLQKYSRTEHMSLDKLLEDLLKQYYKVWRAGYIKACIDNLEKYLKAFLETLTESQRIKGDYVVSGFITWLCEKNAPVSEASVDEYIEYYKSGRGVKYSTISSYRKILLRFVEFYEETVRVSFSH
ncbi:MAG: hypothetical protein QW182_05650 [Thermosphaera sp.]